MAHKDPAAKRAYMREWKRRNRDRLNASERAHYDPTRRRIYDRKYWSAKYGLTPAGWDYWKSLPCDICGEWKPITIDHDHKTGRIRGALCRTCNAGIGVFGDDAEGLRKALSYLERAEARAGLLEMV